MSDLSRKNDEGRMVAVWMGMGMSFLRNMAVE